MVQFCSINHSLPNAKLGLEEEKPPVNAKDLKLLLKVLRQCLLAPFPSASSLGKTLPEKLWRLFPGGSALNPSPDWTVIVPGMMCCTTDVSTTRYYLPLAFW